MRKSAQYFAFDLRVILGCRRLRVASQQADHLVELAALDEDVGLQKLEFDRPGPRGLCFARLPRPGVRGLQVAVDILCYGALIQSVGRWPGRLTSCQT